MRHKPALIFVALAAVAAVAGTVLANLAFSSANARPTVLDRPAGTADAVSPGSGVQHFANPKPGQTRDLGSWRDSEGTVRRLILTSTDSTLASDKPVTCIALEDANGNAGGGCNPASDFFAGAPIVWTEAQRTGNDGVTRDFFVGVSRDNVASIGVVKSTGETDSVPVNGDGGFFYQVPVAESKADVSVVALVPYDGSGGALKSIPTQ